MKRFAPLLLFLAACDYSAPPLCASGSCLQATCHKDPDCTLAHICAVDQCVPGCRSNRDCPTGSTCDPHQGSYGVCNAVAVPDAAVVVTPDVAVTPDMAVPMPDGAVTPDMAVPTPDGAAPDVFVPPPPDAAPPDSTPNTTDAGCAQMSLPVLVNGNFDQGPGHGWNENPASGEELIVQAGGSFDFPRSSPYMLWLGGIVNSTESVTQWLSVPSDTTGVTLSGYYWVRTAEPSGASAVDVASFDVTVGLLLPIPLGSLSNRHASSTWVPFTMSTAIIYSQFTSLRISQSNSASNATSLYLDDLQLTATVCR